MKLEFIIFFFLFGVKAVLSICPNVNFGLNTVGKSFQVFIYESGTFSRSGALADQIESISKSDVESEFFVFLPNKFSEIFLIQK